MGIALEDQSNHMDKDPLNEFLLPSLFRLLFGICFLNCAGMDELQWLLLWDHTGLGAYDFVVSFGMSRLLGLQF